MNSSVDERLLWIQKETEGGSGIFLSTSFGAQSVVMIHLVQRIFGNIKVVFIDTGYLFKETYKYADKLIREFDLDVQVYSPKMMPSRQEALYGKQWEQGVEGINRYNYMNKVEPMERATRENKFTVWISGIRWVQSNERKKIDFFQKRSGILKVHPIIDWSDEQVNEYIDKFGLPRHPLVDQGYVSIGDVHSTRKLQKNMNSEETRFGGLVRECGLHVRNNAIRDQNV